MPWAFVAEYAVESIRAAAGALWPGEPLRLVAHIPSVTSYVHRVRVGHRDLYAKYSFLGKSLISVLRGTHGDRATVLAEQQRYLARTDGVVDREAEQLRRLADGGLLRVCTPAGRVRGVLFTEAVTDGVPLDRLLLINPDQAGTLLRQAWESVARLHHLSPDGWPVMPERDVEVTFARKFTRTSWPPQDALAPYGVAGELGGRLRRAALSLAALPAVRGGSVLVFGEVKPEHVIMTGTGPVFLDPGVHLATTSAAELAKFVSRCGLLLVTRAPNRNTRRQVLAGLSELIGEQQEASNSAHPDAWMADLVTVLVRDMINIVSTCLAMPPAGSMPSVASGVLDHCVVIVSVIERAVTRLARHGHPMDVWDLFAAEVMSA